MIIGERIKKLRLEKMKMTQVAFADAINVSKQTLYKYENGIITNIPSDKIESIANLCKVSPAELMGWTTSNDEDSAGRDALPTFSNIHPIETKRFPVLGEIACGTPIFMDEERELYIESGANIHADFCLIARGDSMINARINDGDIVFIQKDVEIVDGQIYAVAIDDEATLKRLYYDRKQNILQLLAENPKYSPMVYSGESLDHIHVLGRAVAFQSDVK